MNNKFIFSLIGIIVISFGILVGLIIFKPNNNSGVGNISMVEIADEEILDDCTDEYEQIEMQKTLAANSEEEKISPNCSLTTRTFFKGCGHVKTEYNNVPEELVNLTKNELQERYKDYEIETFSANEIVLYADKEGECEEHFLVKENNGKVVVYKKDENGEKELFEETNISTDYLPETDKIAIQNGIEIVGKQNLNSFIEDYE